MTDRPAYEVLLYYKFVHVPDPAATRAEHEALCKSLGLLGRILIAKEGINGTLSGTPEACLAYREAMNAHPLFHGTEFKIDPYDTHAFRKLNVRVKKELVNLGIDEDYDPAEETGNYIEPQEMQELLRDTPEDVVILDTRSNYEYEVGRFKGAVAFDIDHFRDLQQFIDRIEELRDKKLVTYCTGGIRCEKVTSLLLRHGFPKDRLYQLHGGIIRYGHETGGEDFEGQCYVFDQRIVVPVNTVNPKVIGNCVCCGTATEKMVNCANAACNDQVLLCPDCGDKMEGCCSDACLASPRRRKWDGTGQYHRGHNSKNYVLAPEVR